MAVRDERLLKTREFFAVQGSAACDVRSTRSFRRISLPEDAVRRDPDARKVAAPFPRFLILCMLAAAVLSVFLILTAVRLAEAKQRISGLERELSKQEMYRAELEAAFAETVDLDEIRTRAAALGMKEPEPAQYRYIEPEPLPERSVPPELFERVIGELRETFLAFLAYVF